MSGWIINSKIIGKIIIKLKINLTYKFLIFFNVSKNPMVIIIKGFKISIGWNLGKNPKLSHLLDPFTSTPKKGTKIRKNVQIRNKIKLT